MSDTGILTTTFGEYVMVRGQSTSVRMKIGTASEFTLSTVTIETDASLSLKENLRGSWELSATRANNEPIRWTGHNHGSEWALATPEDY